MALSTKWGAVLSVLLLAACDDATPDESCDNSPWTYSNTGDPFMRTWCTSCHHTDMADTVRPDGTEGINLDGFGNVAAFLERIEARALGDSPTMPPAGGPSEVEREQLAEWIACGAPE